MRTLMLRKIVLASLLVSGCMRTPVRLVIKDKPSETLTKKGQEALLRAVLYDKDGLILDATDPIVWSSSDANVATVDKTGKVAAQHSGEAKITAKLKELHDEAMARVSIVGNVELE